MSNCVRKSWSSSAECLPQERFFRRIDVDPEEARQKLRHASIAIKQFAAIDVLPLCALLRSLGIKVNQTPADLLVLVTDTYLTSHSLDEAVQASLQARVPCLILQPTGVTSLAGPLIHPEDCCWPCLKKVLSRHHPVPQSIQRLKQTDEKVTAPVAYLSLTLSHCYAFVAQAILLYLVKGTLTQLEQHIYSLNSHTLEQHAHYIVPWVSCSTCRARQKSAFPQPPALQLAQSPHAIEAAATHVTLENDLDISLAILCGTG